MMLGVRWVLTITAGIVLCVVHCESFSVSGRMELRCARDAFGISTNMQNRAPGSACIRLRMEQGNNERGWLHHFVSHAFHHQLDHVRHHFFQRKNESEPMPSNSTLDAELGDQEQNLSTTLSALEYDDNLELYASSLIMNEEQMQAKIASLEDQWQQDESNEMVEDSRTADNPRLRDFLEMLYTQSCERDVERTLREDEERRLWGDEGPPSPP